MLDTMAAAALEDVERAEYIAGNIAVRILERVAHAGLGAEVHDALEFLAREELGHARLVGEVELHETKAALAVQLRQARALERDVVVVIEVIQSDDLIAARQQAPRSE